MDDDTPDYVIRAGLPSQHERRFLPRSKRAGPPPGMDYFTLTAKHGRPIGAFEENGRQTPYKG